MIMTRPLGSTQKNFLWNLFKEKGWYQGCGWIWGDRHTGILESLMKRGLVSAEVKDIPAPSHSFGYDPEKHGRVWRKTVYTITEHGVEAIKDRIAHVAAANAEWAEKNRREQEQASAAAAEAQKYRDETREAIEAVRDRLRAQMSNFEVEALSRAIDKFR
jgi:predicted ArsR family transcriptional regulator